MNNQFGISCIMDENTVNETISKISDQIYDNFSDMDKLCVIGIRRRGADIARKITENLTEKSGGKSPSLGELDITLYRDDLATLKELPIFFLTNIPFDIHNMNLILVDDVLYTGRSVRAAFDALFLMGRPSIIKLAVLIDRGGRELPIHADYTGKALDTSATEYLKVKTRRFDGETAVYLYDKKRSKD
ncbi:MAG TPA: bifunctional pyr operon transcriptional regulator/uracil phosphoribosyltransferase PyrR [Oscillospiraceae bacterium]|nr:bifunctional pyr operon transcriptional regulator/uracil phosphoribosyltransferase PyrR [Oscillospiraceae bacterium]